MNLAHLLAEQAASRPRAAAIIDARHRQQRVLTFADLEVAAARAAGLLHQSGLRAGDAVLVFQPMSIDLYVALAAVFRLGLVAMFLDPGAGREHIEQCCALWAPRGLIACPKAHLLRLISPALRRIPIQFSVGWPLPWASSFSRWHRSEPEPMADLAAETPALATFTSGSTGRPKAALRTHGFLLQQQQALERALTLVPGEVDLTTLPTFALANLASGVTTVIPQADLRSSRWARPSAVVRQIESEGIDRIGAAPAFLEWLADFCLAQGHLLPGLKKIYTGGGPVFPKLMDRLRRFAPHARITALYGCTEAEPIAVVERGEITREDQEAMAGGAGLLAGRVDDRIAARIIADGAARSLGPWASAEFEATCLSDGQAGEIVVRGAHVLRGYLNPSDDAETKIRVGDAVWHRTGDAGYLDRHGRLWLLGRCRARVDDAHGRIYPFEIESTVRQRTKTCQAALITDQGERVLYVDRRGLAELDALQPELTHWHVDRVKVVKSLPKDRRHRSKIDYTALGKD